ncbi:hypothetical protein N7488_005172 [Penicillium malachiteum]|nr:hypothetical protein N7488_005172 [Penicillium malachiteum]
MDDSEIPVPSLFLTFSLLTSTNMSVILTKWNKHWPGGISSFLRSHDEPVDDVLAAFRAWRFFVREQWVDGEGDDVHEQRRALVERWATADQAFRDSYQSRVPEDERAFEKTEDDACLVGLVSRVDDVHICLTKWTLETQALLAKCLITLFGWDGAELYSFGIMSMEEFPLFFVATHPNSDPLEEALQYMDCNGLGAENPELILENDREVDMWRPFVEIFQHEDRDDVDRYAPGFCEAEEAGGGLAIGYELEWILADNGGPLKILEG